MSTYTREQEVILREIAKGDKSTWNSSIKSILGEMDGRKLATVWQKVYSLSGHSPRSVSNKKPRAVKQKYKLVKKNKQYKKVKTPAQRKAEWRARQKEKAAKVNNKPTYRRKLHKSPLRGTTMHATANELRFPIESLRIEGGELIVTFK